MAKKQTKKKTASRDAAPRYAILSIDGGGVRGIIAAVWLDRLRREVGRPIGELFDLIAGTSTGSILACGLAIGLEPAEIVDLYRVDAATVFPDTASRLWSRLSRTFTQGPSAPKYSDEGLAEVLQRRFGDARFGSLQPKALVTAYNVRRRDSVVFKSWYPRFAELPAWEVVKASCSAPTYFPAHLMTIATAEAPQGELTPLVDGGVVANNPTACAIAEAIRLTRDGEHGDTACAVEDFVVLSFGTGNFTRPISIRQSREWGPLEWAIPVIDVLFDGAADATDYIAQQVIPTGRYVRFQTPLTTGYDDMDDASATNLEALVRLAERYLDEPENRRKLKQAVTELTRVRRG